MWINHISSAHSHVVSGSHIEQCSLKSHDYPETQPMPSEVASKPGAHHLFGVTESFEDLMKAMIKAYKTHTKNFALIFKRFRYLKLIHGWLPPHLKDLREEFYL